MTRKQPSEPKLLTRTEFRDQVFARDGYKCVFCTNPAEDAHHIMERRLWPNGGYYLDNGASVCSEHHIQCERTDISVEEVRAACNAEVILPPHLYKDQVYDKWGNPIIGTTRLRGELFYDENVQKALDGKASLFSSYFKYPRTYHLPWSEGVSDTDRVMTSTAQFRKIPVVVTEKMDGENTSMYRDYIHARSLDSPNHPSRSWVKNFHSKIKHDIPHSMRICGENLFAKHSIEYNELESFFLGFSVWHLDMCLSWDTTLEWLELLDIPPVKVLYDGVYDEALIREIYTEDKRNTSEGYVVRVKHHFTLRNFKDCVGKFVRRGHVQTDDHWMQGRQLQRNTMRTNE